MKFLFYKIYRYAVTQEKAVGTSFAFLMYVSIFELIHILIIGGALSIAGYSMDIGEESVWSITTLAIMTFINYLFFIRNKRIEKINEYYQTKNQKARKGDIIFFSYIIMLFSLMAIETYISVQQAS
jgi:uncharacterized membrane protein